jgi:tRNA threonylcarbamoyladenosine biosynthesis protein TsaE
MNGPFCGIERALPDPAATEALAGAVAALVRPGDAILLGGPLGAGKSAFARALLRALADDPALEVPSPSFTLVQTYDTRVGAVHHFDLWRIDLTSDLIELGWEELVRDVIVVEWPDRLGPLAPADALRIDLAIEGSEARRVRITGWPDRLASLR